MVIILYAEKNENTIERMLGMPDYSYYFVLREFRPVLERLATTVTVRDPRLEVDAIHGRCRRTGEPCIFLSFTPPHDTLTDLACPTIPVFAWEFYDIPDETWDHEVRNDWSMVLGRLGCAITHSEFATTAVRQSMGEDFPVASIPAPVWDRFARASEACRADPYQPGFELSWHGKKVDSRAPDAPINPIYHRPESLSASVSIDLDFAQVPDNPPMASHQSVNIEGIVYTSIFNPNDGRKNWLEIVRTFCLALRDREDATLVLKLTHSGIFRTERELVNELRRLMPFRCRVVVVDGFLGDADYEKLLHGTSYAVNASLGEGQCLPLMEYMSSGKPAIAPCHTGMAGYLEADNAFLVASSLEPCSWPQDPRAMYRTRRHRIDAQSLMLAFRESYSVATRDPDRYRIMSENAKNSLRRHCSAEVVERKLRAFLQSRFDHDGLRAGIK